MELIRPKKLRRGDRIAIVAPASQVRTDELLQGVDVLKEMGFRPVLGPSLKKLNTVGLYDASPEDRARELMWAFNHPEIEGIICALGGFGSAELLPYLDFREIRRSRKVFIGKSDITALNNGILTKSGLINFCGKTAMMRRSESGGYVETDAESLKLTLELCMSHEPWGSTPLQLNQFIPRCIKPGRARGVAIGGNLETLTCLLGTEYFPDPAGTILFLEDVHKSGTNVARRLLHLKMAGVLDSVAAVVAGEFAESPNVTKTRDDITIPAALQEFLCDVPSTYGYSFSHGTHIMPIPIGSIVEVDTETGELNFNFTMG